MKIVMVAGGTGGHIYPALALAQALEKKGHSVTFIGSNDRMEKDIIPNHGFKYIGLDVYSTSGSIFKKIKSIFSIIKAYFKCLKILANYDMAIGFGNYISLPVMKAATKLKLKTIIHEQNSFVGRANLLLDKDVDLVIGSYEENRKQFKNHNLKIIGNPQSSKAYMVKKDENLISNMGLDPHKKTVLIFMGSLGSNSVNKVLLDYFKLLDGSYNVIYASGKSYYQMVKDAVKETAYLKIFESVEGVKCMRSADLLVSRAGATTLCEIQAVGIASILIPSPFVPNNHQYYNGLALVNNDAATMIEEKNLTSIILATTVKELLNDENRLETLKNNALKLGNPHVLDDMIVEVEKL